MSVRVFIIDDSAVVRQVLTEVLSADREIEVVGAAADPLFAMRRMEQAWPDVIVLDVEMPRMDGITFLRQIMAQRPTPVVMCSTLTVGGAKTTLDALGAGAVEVVAKPRGDLRSFFSREAANLVRVVKAAAGARTERLRRPANPAPLPVEPAPAAARRPLSGLESSLVVACGASTGGTHALETLLTALPVDCPPVVIVQHMPEKFTAAFAERLNGLCRINVREAVDGDKAVVGSALIAPGGRHMLLRRGGGGYYVEVRDGPLVNRHRPSVDVLFRSTAQVAGANAMGIIMTGMGDDGASGLLEMLRAGAVTLGQNEATCVVYGMPREAARRGAVQREVPLEVIAAEVVRFGGGRGIG